MFHLSRSILIILTLSMALSMLCIGLFPFNYLPSNKAIINEDAGDLTFSGRGIAYIKDLKDWPPENSFTLEIVLTSSKTHTRRIPHILSLCDTRGQETIYLGQWNNSLIIRAMKKSRWTEKIISEAGIDQILIPGEPAHISIVYREGNITVYTGRKMMGRMAGLDSGDAAARPPIRYIVLGNSPGGNDPWMGRISDLSVWNTALSPMTIQDRFERWSDDRSADTTGPPLQYSMGESESEPIDNKADTGWELIVPDLLTPLKRDFLEIPSTQFFQRKIFYEDALINVLGFIPLGAILAVFFYGCDRKKNRAMSTFLFPVLGGGLLSLFIEANQAFLVTRNSSLTDLVMNIAGSGAGVGIWWVFGQKKGARY